MKPRFAQYENKELQDLALRLNVLFTRLGSDNLGFKELRGTTNSSANTEQLFKHGMSPKPRIVIPLEGDVYVYRIYDDTVDVRSTQTSMVFKILALGQ